MKRPDLERLIEEEEKRINESPIRATVSVMMWLTNRHHVYTRVSGKELADACLLACVNHDLGWKLYWFFHARYKELYGRPFTGESDEDMGRYSIEILKVVAKEILNEVT